MALDVVNGIRIAEDSIMSFIVAFSFVIILNAGLKLKKYQIPIASTPLLASIGLIPLLTWKLMGAYRRIFVDKATDPELYTFLHDTGEAFEAFAGLTLAIVLLLIYRKSTAMMK